MFYMNFAPNHEFMENSYFTLTNKYRALPEDYLFIENMCRIVFILLLHLSGRENQWFVAIISYASHQITMATHRCVLQMKPRISICQKGKHTIRSH